MEQPALVEEVALLRLIVTGWTVGAVVIQVLGWLGIVVLGRLGIGAPAYVVEEMGPYVGEFCLMAIAVRLHTINGPIVRVKVVGLVVAVGGSF
jgi:hypothetical protein